MGQGPKAVLFVNDIFGPRSGGGRQQLFCDELAKLGLTVLMPDYFRGESKSGRPSCDCPPPPLLLFRRLRRPHVKCVLVVWPDRAGVCEVR